MAENQLDPMPILAALGVANVESVEPVSVGFGDTVIWRVQAGATDAALRVFPAGDTAGCGHEAAAMRAAAAGGVPAPRVLAEGAWRDRPALLLSWCPGRPVAAELAARPWRAWALGLHLGRMQASIHAVPAPDALRLGDRDWIAWAGPDELRVQERLRALRPRTDALLHLDYHPLNVVTDGRRLTGVLDWANARAGDPRADVARTFTLLRLAPIPPGYPRRRAALVRRLLELGWRRGYRQAAGPLVDMAPVYAWAGAVMLRDLEPKLGRPGVWLEPHHLDPVRRQVEIWKRRAGLPA